MPRLFFYFLFRVGKVTTPDWNNITRNRQEQHRYSDPLLMICERRSFKWSDRYTWKNKIRAFSKAAWQKKKKNNFQRQGFGQKETFCQGTFLNFVTFWIYFFTFTFRKMHLKKILLREEFYFLEQNTTQICNFFFFFSFVFPNTIIWVRNLDSWAERYSEVERKPFVIVLKAYHLPESWGNRVIPSFCFWR